MRNQQSAVRNPNRQSAVSIENRQSQSAIVNLKIRSLQSTIRNRHPVQMKHLVERDALWALIRVGGHQLTHVGPPPFADVSPSNGVPLRFTFELDVPEQVIRLSIEEDRVGVNAVLEKRALEILPDRLMPADVLSLVTGMDRH